MARPRLGPVLFSLRVGVGVEHAWGTGHSVPPSGVLTRKLEACFSVSDEQACEEEALRRPDDRIDLS